jgi:hypothetical protein
MGRVAAQAVLAFAAHAFPGCNSAVMAFVIDLVTGRYGTSAGDLPRKHVREASAPLGVEATVPAYPGIWLVKPGPASVWAAAAVNLAVEPGVIIAHDAPDH